MISTNQEGGASTAADLQSITRKAETGEQFTVIFHSSAKEFPSYEWLFEESAALPVKIVSVLAMRTVSPKTQSQRLFN